MTLTRSEYAANIHLHAGARRASPAKLARIHARRRRAASDEPSPAISFMAGAAFCFLFFTVLFSF